MIAASRRAARGSSIVILTAWLLSGTSPSFAQDSAPTEQALAAAFPDLGGMDARAMMMEDPFNTLVLLDQLELREGDDVVSWDIKAWAGRDFDKLFIRSEGERQSGATEHAEIELLWAHTIAPWWDVVVGLRQDFEPNPSQSWVAIGIQGLAPYEFDVEATAFIGEGGQASARLEAEYELLITQRLILQPLVELDWYAQDDPERRIGSGFASIEASLRLRYEIRREIAPYVGIVRSRKLGDTADLARANGRDPGDTSFLAGIRVWF